MRVIKAALKVRPEACVLGLRLTFGFIVQERFVPSFCEPNSSSPTLYSFYAIVCYEIHARSVRATQ